MRRPSRAQGPAMSGHAPDSARVEEWPHALGMPSPHVQITVVRTVPDARLPLAVDIVLSLLAGVIIVQALPHPLAPMVPWGFAAGIGLPLGCLIFATLVGPYRFARETASRRMETPSPTVGNHGSA
jgi:hypothetical protein